MSFGVRFSVVFFFLGACFVLVKSASLGDEYLEDIKRESDVVDLLRRLANEPKSGRKDEVRRAKGGLVLPGKPQVFPEKPQDQVDKVLHEELEEAIRERKKYGSILIENGVEQKPHLSEDVELFQPAGVDGDRFQTDMVLSHSQQVELGITSELPDEVLKIGENIDEGIDESKRKYIAPTGGKQLWPDGIIPWDFSASRNFSKTKSHKNVLAALKHYEENTCLRFARRNSTLAHTVKHKNYMDFGTGSGCWAFVGMTGQGAQAVTLQENACLKLGTILHEIGHSLGMYHEQIRMDRNEHVTVDFANIASKARGNFEMKAVSYNYAPYDLESDLQYGKFYFSKNDRPTIKTKDPDLGFLIDPPNRGGLSFYDMMAVNRAYSCNAPCRKPLRKCQNHGFVGHMCTCVCPSGLAGSDCSRLDRGMSPTCGGIITLTGDGDSETFTSPKYPGITDKTTCVWLIKTSPEQYINLEFLDFDLARTKSWKQEFKCENTVQVRYNLIGQTGPRFCGSGMGSKTFSTMTNVRGREKDMWIMMVLLESGGKNIPQRGFKAKVTARDVPGCMKKSCYNGGTCEDGGTKRAVCRCKQGFVGTSCEGVGDAVSRNNFDDDSDNGGFCGLKNVDGDEGNWRRTKGKTPSDNTGPLGDVRGQGAFLYVEASGPQKSRSKLRLETISSFQDRKRCLEFAYSMCGNCMGTLQIFQSGNGQERQLWDRSGNQGQRWLTERLTLPPMGHDYKVIIQGTVGSCFLSDLAIDEVNILPHGCNDDVGLPQVTRALLPDPTRLIPKPTIRPTTTTTVTTTTTTRIQPQVVAASGASIVDYTTSCDFEKGFCDFTQASNDDFDWVRQEGATSTQNTGPNGDHTSGSGKYALIESSGKQKGDTATLELPLSHYSSGEACLEFWYNNFGFSPSSLYVTVQAQGPPNTIFYSNASPARQVKSRWQWVQVQIKNKGKFKVSFSGHRGDDFGGDLAIDDISIQPGSCAKANQQIKCDFEGDSCKYEQAPDDDFDWTLQTGTTPSDSTGPSVDHTTGNGHYMFIEASVPAETNWRAALLLPYAQFTGPSCLYFWYNNNSPQVSKLYVETRLDDDTRKTVFTADKNTGDTWLMAGVQLSIKERFRIAFLGIRGSGHLGDLAIDDISLASGACTKVDFTVSCDFETSIEDCGLEQVQEDDYDWEITTGPTTTTGTGPTGDHTTGRGHYAYIDASGKTVNFNAAIVTPSVVYPLAKSCIRLWYHSKGSSLSKLQIFTLHPDGTNDNIWASDDTSSDEWRPIEVQVNRTGLFRFAIIATRGRSNLGDIAIDDIDIKPGGCGSVEVFSCNFNEGTCGMGFVSDANADWMLAKKPYSTDYGPLGGDKTGTGHYVIMVEQTRGTAGSAKLLTPFLDLREEFCLKVYTQIYDGREATMKVSALKRDGTQRGGEYTLGLGSIVNWKGWLQVQLGFPASYEGEFRVEFDLSKTAKISQGFAFDDMTILSGKCP